MSPWLVSHQTDIVRQQYKYVIINTLSTLYSLGELLTHDVWWDNSHGDIVKHYKNYGNQFNHKYEEFCE